MRIRKIRGHNRRFKHIESWRLYNLSLDLNDYLTNHHCYYAKIRVHPWSGISLINSLIPEPKGKAKLKIINGLLDIYDDWKDQLDKLGQPYYLKIWLFEPRFSQSQVVCAIGDRIDYYENRFFNPKNDKIFNSNKYGQLKSKLSKLNWDYRLDEDEYDNSFVGDPELYASIDDYEDTKIWFNKLLKKTHRLVKFDELIGDTIESYSFKRGDLWIGEQK